MTEIAMLSRAIPQLKSKWLPAAWVIALVSAAILMAYNFAAIPLKASSCADAAFNASGRDPLTALHMLDYAATLEPMNAAYPAMMGEVFEHVNDFEKATQAYLLASVRQPEEAIYRFKAGLVSGSLDEITLARLMEPGNPIFAQDLSR